MSKEKEQLQAEEIYLENTAHRAIEGMQHDLETQIQRSNYNNLWMKFVVSAMRHIFLAHIIRLIIMMPTYR
jgi:hypothetical protein